MALSDLEVQALIGKTRGKERLLCSLGIGTGISVADAQKLCLGAFSETMELNGRRILVPMFVLRQIDEFRDIAPGDAIFTTCQEAMRWAVVKAAERALGRQVTYKELRETFIRICMEAGLPFHVIVRNTGARPETVYAVCLRYVKIERRDALDAFQRAFPSL